MVEVMLRQCFLEGVNLPKYFGMIFVIPLELLPNGGYSDYKKNLYSTSAYVQAARVRERILP